MLPYIEIILGKIRNSDKNKELIAERTQESKPVEPVDGQKELIFRNKKHTSSDLHRQNDYEVADGYDEISNAADLLNADLKKKAPCTGFRYPGSTRRYSYPFSN